MYKNFSITEKEKQQILESHMKHGYKKPLNELGDKEIDLIKGKTNIKLKGRPSGDGLAAKEFERDFEKDHIDSSDEFTPYWEKDRPFPSNDSEIETDIRTNIRQADRELSADPEREMELSKQQHKEELKQLGRKISSIIRHKNEFGGDELDGVLEKLKSQYRELDNM